MLSALGKHETETESDDLGARWFKPAPEGSGLLRDQTLARLKEDCRKGNYSRPPQMDLRGISLVGEDLAELNLSGYDLSGADLSDANLTRTNLSHSNLSGINLYKAVLTGAEFMGANLSGANLNEVSAERAGFGVADLSRTSLISADLTRASFSRACLRRADLRAAVLHLARITEADLSHASFIRADLLKADLKACDVRGASFELANLRKSRLMSVVHFDQANWVGADVREMDPRGAYLIRRHIADENYLYEFKNKSTYHRWLYYLWWLTSDCGQSIGRWSTWVLGGTILFGFLYMLVDVDFGPNSTPFSPFYFSIVTLTTLGYGDVLPASLAAQILAALQAVLGYISLGGMLSILSNKMARRAD